MFRPVAGGHYAPAEEQMSLLCITALCCRSVSGYSTDTSRASSVKPLDCVCGSHQDFVGVRVQVGVFVSRAKALKGSFWLTNYFTAEETEWVTVYTALNEGSLLCVVKIIYCCFSTRRWTALWEMCYWGSGCGWYNSSWLRRCDGQGAGRCEKPAASWF